MNSPTGQRARREIFSVFSVNMLKQAIQFAFGIALARILTPEDFGVYAMATVVIAVGHVFSGLGLGSAVVQHRGVSDEHLTTVGTVSLAAGVIISLLVLLASPLAGSWYRNELVSSVVAALSVVFTINAFNVVPSTILWRQVRLARLYLVGLIVLFITGPAAVWLAFRGWGVWSFVAAEIIGQVATVVLTSYFAGWWPRLGYRHSSMIELFHFTSWMTGKNLLTALSTSIEVFTIGRWLPARDVGIYGRGQGLVELPLSHLGSIISNVLFPVFARLQDDLERLRVAYLKTVCGASLVILPVFAGIALIAPAFIPIVFGNQWTDAVPITQILCLFGVVRSMTYFSQMTLDSRAAVAPQVKITACYAVTLVLLISGGAGIYGLPGAAWGVVLSAGMFFALIQFTLLRNLGITWSRFVRELEPAATSTAFMVLAVVLTRPWLGIQAESLEMLFVALIGGPAVYLTGLIIRRHPTVHAIVEDLAGDYRPGWMPRVRWLFSPKGYRA